MRPDWSIARLLIYTLHERSSAVRPDAGTERPAPTLLRPSNRQVRRNGAVLHGVDGNGHHGIGSNDNFFNVVSRQSALSHSGRGYTLHHIPRPSLPASGLGL